MEAERGGEQLAGTDTAVSDLSSTPAGKQTGSPFDLWSASPAGRPLLRLKEAGEGESVIIIIRILTSQRYGRVFCLVLFVSLASQTVFDSAKLNTTAWDAL